ncbi:MULTISPECIES: hypothetical protein [unclassified Novosphingobium]|uniref:hypothetical protein n=1 Tax=unclassified Novosphingobium TaxID=2644732 RepID=UPI00146B2EE6|nr:MULTISPECIES: hypothetical protein [unclassified Novosphingobium]NMN06246.1 hypothetical protein [Novosphingobium sp. SG919]NMN88543.1 hypothetical protein [Novosphingobium sp. SG916]
MILSAQRLRSIGWLALLAVCGALVMILSFRVNALRSQVHRAEGQIVALKQQKMYLETEFETRANQQQLKAWNDLEFGYVAPVAGQYLENERQLAVLSKPAEPDAPAPIRVATVDDSVIAAAAFPALSGEHAGVRPLAETHEAERDGAGGDDGGAGKPRNRALDHAEATATLAEKLGTLHAPSASKAAHKRDGGDEKGEKRDKAPAKRVATVEKAKPQASRDTGAQTKAVAKSAKADKDDGKGKAKAKPAVKTAQKTAHTDRKTGVKTSR